MGVERVPALQEGLNVATYWNWTHSLQEQHSSLPPVKQHQRYGQGADGAEEETEWTRSGNRKEIVGEWGSLELSLDLLGGWTGPVSLKPERSMGLFACLIGRWVLK